MSSRAIVEARATGLRLAQKEQKMTDGYLRGVLTVIAVALTVIAFGELVRPARSALECGTKATPCYVSVNLECGGVASGGDTTCEFIQLNRDEAMERRLRKNEFVNPR